MRRLMAPCDYPLSRRSAFNDAENQCPEILGDGLCVVFNVLDSEPKRFDTKFAKQRRTERFLFRYGD
ncbi:hypothetical protein CEXT_87071 [Caerostris extrusa]|uniref:Uncharacterized protein n=1 Tax=Caerostris extrusa TaxID=172846 RepID=A0AAV4NVE7_CAEEX|nr:hypothetical protein CEXT_87071 [Caerostris extrusa]